jgi:hypothetical protein
MEVEQIMARLLEEMKANLGKTDVRRNAGQDGSQLR